SAARAGNCLPRWRAGIRRSRRLHVVGWWTGGGGWEQTAARPGTGDPSGGRGSPVCSGASALGVGGLVVGLALVAVVLAAVAWVGVAFASEQVGAESGYLLRPARGGGQGAERGIVVRLVVSGGGVR